MSEVIEGLLQKNNKKHNLAGQCGKDSQNNHGLENKLEEANQLESWGTMILPD